MWGRLKPLGEPMTLRGLLVSNPCVRRGEPSSDRGSGRLLGPKLDGVFPLPTELTV